MTERRGEAFSRACIQAERLAGKPPEGGGCYLHIWRIRLQRLGRLAMNLH